MSKRIIIPIIVGAVILGLGIVAGACIRRPPPPLPPVGANPTPQLNFINPTVVSRSNKHFIINFQPLKEKIADIQKEYANKTYIYFVYLNNASWVGLNEKDKFVAASTVKVPLAMSLFKAMEDGRLKLSDNYALEELDLSGGFGDLYKVGPDAKFTVEELVKIMLEKSDNTAMTAIVNIFSKLGINDPLADVYKSMGWGDGDEILFSDLGNIPNYQEITLKVLSDMFLALYNAQYVDAAHSQQILEYLSNSSFNDKIVAGVPQDITVAHKIGVSAENQTFSDCGIVYAPNRNYLLCLGSNGADEKTAAKFMAEVSKAAYQFVINN
jgi:beta-lactamase class A